MLETMFRSGVPPHMGQSPVPGSAAELPGINVEAVRSKKMNATEAMVIVVLCMTVDYSFFEDCLIIPIHFDVIKVDFCERAAKNAGCSLAIWNRIDALDHPRARFSVRGKPNFTAGSSSSIRQILHFKFHSIPGIRFPRERNSYRPFDLWLPRLDVEHLAVAIEC